MFCASSARTFVVLSPLSVAGASVRMNCAHFVFFSAAVNAASIALPLSPAATPGLDSPGRVAESASVPIGVGASVVTAAGGGGDCVAGRAAGSDVAGRGAGFVTTGVGGDGLAAADVSGRSFSSFFRLHSWGRPLPLPWRRGRVSILSNEIASSPSLR